MSTMGTFDAFTAARLGIYAAQHGLRVTGNNVSNINTAGYTRQRLDQVSFKAGAYDRYRSQLDNHVGSGALVMNINQVRDPYLDVRYRNVSADVGYHDTMLDGLNHIQSILDEVGKGEDAGDNEKGDGLLHAQIQDLRDKLLAFSKEPTVSNNNLVRTSASILCGMFNDYARKLDTLYQETVEDFNSQVTEINECLTNIRDLNREIRDCEIYGDNALELRDERNRQIDTLSHYLHIKVIYTEEDVGCGQKVEKLSIYLDDENPDPKMRTDDSMLIDGVFGSQLTVPEERVVLNPYFGSDIAGLEGVKNFLYLTDQPLEDPNDPTKFLYLLEDGKTVASFAPNDAANPVPDGAKAIMKGTNFVEDAAKVDNDIFAVEISKLLDVNNKEWESRTRVDPPLEVGEDAFVNYEIQLTLPGATDRADGKELKIGERVFTFKDNPTGADEISSGISNEELMDLIARNLYNSDYTVRAHPDTAAKPTTLVFTARQPGSAAALAAQGIGQPGVTIDADGTALNATFMGMSQDGKDLPANERDDDTGVETLYSYVKYGNEWKQVTTTVKHTYEVALDDNDTRGSLQAVRELLTENGQFTTKDTVANVDENAASKRGIPYYQKSLDLLAREFAKQYNQLNQGTPVDQNGDPITSSTVKQTLPRLKEENGQVYALDETTGKYELKKDWAIVDVGGIKYAAEKAADGNTYFTGLHGDTCYIQLHPIPVDQGTKAIYDKLQEVATESGNAGAYALDPAILADLTATPPAKTWEDTDVKAEVEKLLAKCLTADGHGVKADDTVEVEIPVPDTMGGPLFSTRNDNNETEGITAANISIAQGWMEDVYGLVPKFEILWDGDVNHSTQNTNADHMVSMIDKLLVFNPQDIVPDAVSSSMFTGDFGDMFSRINTVLGQDIRANQIDLNNSYIQQVEIDTNRDGVSGVDLNDEAMNIMQYQKAMNAAMRLMTVVDEVLDRLINNTGIAGR